MHAYLSECMHANDIFTFNYLLCAKLNTLKHEKLHKIRVNMHDILQNCMQAEKLLGGVMPNAQVFLPLWIGEIDLSRESG